MNENNISIDDLVKIKGQLVCDLRSARRNVTLIDKEDIRERIKNKE